MWRPQAAFFRKNYQVITYDARGFGQSSLPERPYRHDEDLHALLEHLGIAKANIVGFSMGGRIAMNFALSHPEKVRSLTLVDTALDGYASTVDWRVHADQAGIEGAKENWLNHSVFSTIQSQPAINATLRTIVAGYSGWHWLHRDTETRATVKARERLHELTMPVLTLVGEKDLPYFHDIATVIQKGITNAQKVVIPNAGHMVNMEAPQEVNKLLAGFIAGSYS